jgi:hypothetical protein
VLRSWFNAGVLMCVMVLSCCPGAPTCSPVTRRLDDAEPLDVSGCKCR